MPGAGSLLLPAVVQRSRDPCLTARSTDVAQFLRSLQDMQPESVYLVLEGHRQTSQVLGWLPGDLALTALFFLVASALDLQTLL